MTTAPGQHRYAVIAELAKLYKDKEGWVLGKTALQKLVFFLQEVRGVALGYEYTLHTFGPFSSTLAADLDVANMMDVVDVTYEPSLNGYEIVPGASDPTIERHAKQWLKSVNGHVEAVFKRFGGYGTRALELRATIAYVAKDSVLRERKLTDDRLVNIVHDLKPHFTPEVISAALQELRESEFLPEKTEAKPKPSLIRRLRGH
jgi:uncharacterized protein YwgA